MRKIKKSWVKILSLALVAVLGFAVIGGLAGSAIKESKTISATSFSRGGLDDKGIHVDTKQSIYTKDAFECSGLKIEQDFESHATYDVYYYDYDGNFLKSDKGLYGNYTADSKFTLAKYARIVIHPEIPADEDVKDYSISFLEVYGIANELKITVDKEQNYLYETENLFVADDNVSDAMHCEIVLYDNGKADSENLKYEYYDVYFKLSTASDQVDIHFDNSTLNEVQFLSQLKGNCWYKVTLEAEVYTGSPGALAYTFEIDLPLGSECYVFGYN